jgi:hypothetical protein
MTKSHPQSWQCSSHYLTRVQRWLRRNPLWRRYILHRQVVEGLQAYLTWTGTIHKVQHRRQVWSIHLSSTSSYGVSELLSVQRPLHLMPDQRGKRQNISNNKKISRTRTIKPDKITLDQYKNSEAVMAGKQPDASYIYTEFGYPGRNIGTLLTTKARNRNLSPHQAPVRLLSRLCM